MEGSELIAYDVRIPLREITDDDVQRTLCSDVQDDDDEVPEVIVTLSDESSSGEEEDEESSGRHVMR